MQRPALSFKRVQIIEHRQGGKKHDNGIGYELLARPHRKLELNGEEDEGYPARSRLHKLIRRCGLLDRSRRPEIRDVLREAKLIFDSLSGSGGHRVRESGEVPVPLATDCIRVSWNIADVTRY